MKNSNLSFLFTIVSFLTFLFAISCKSGSQGKKTNQIRAHYSLDGKLLHEILSLGSDSIFFGVTYAETGEVECTNWLIKVASDSFIKNGPFVCYYPSGDTFSRGTYKMGRQIGKKRFFFPEGGLKRIESSRVDSISELFEFDVTGKVNRYGIAYAEELFFDVRYRNDSICLEESAGLPIHIVAYDYANIDSQVSEQGIIIVGHEPKLVKREVEFMKVTNNKTGEDITLQAKLKRKDSLVYYYDLPNRGKDSLFMRIKVKTYLYNRNSEPLIGIINSYPAE